MKFRFYYIPALIGGMAVLHFVAVFTGLYDYQVQQGFVWFDNVLHVIDGIAVGLFWLWVLEKRKRETISMWAMISVAIFVLCMAIVWEGVEAFSYIFFNDFARSAKVFSPSVFESASDILSNMVGVVVLLWWVKHSNRLTLDKAEAEE